MSAIGFALFTFVLCSYTNMSATVRPHDTEILIDMEPEPEPEPEPQKIEVKAGIQPRTEEPEPKKPIKLVQKSQAQTVAKRANEGPESTVGGLIVGIIAYFCYNFLTSRISDVVYKMENSTIEFMDALESGAAKQSSDSFELEVE